VRIPPNLGRSAVIVVALLSAGFFAAYLRFMPYLKGGSTYTDGTQEQQLAEVDQLRFAVWDDAQLLSEAVNGPDSEGRAAISPDGRYLVFTSGEPGLNTNLWRAELVEGEPVNPRPLTRINTVADELAPAFDDDKLYFASNRAGSEGGYDLYSARYEDGRFGPPTRLPGGVNTVADELDPAPQHGTQAIAFASNRRRGRRDDFDLYVTRPAPATTLEELGIPGEDDESATPVALPDSWLTEPFEALNSPFDEREPAFTRDGNGVLFASDRIGGMGGFDIWRSVRSGGEWQPPDVLGGINSTGTERAPLPSTDGFTLLFVGAPEEGTSDIYRARSRELFRLPGRPVGWLDLTILGLLLLLALLAWLGRRWETLDILYKCLLVSMIVHLGLMLWFREVPMEPEEMDVGRSTPSFKVRLAPSRETMSRSKERAGQLDVSRETLAEAQAPGRQTTEAQTDAAASEAADLAAAQRSVELDQPDMPQAATPGRAAEAFDRPERAVSEAVAVAQPEASTERRQAAAPVLNVDAREGPSAPSEPALAARSAPARQQSAQQASAARPEAGPARVELGLPATRSAVPTPGRRQVAVAPQRQSFTEGGREVDVQGPASLPSVADSSDTGAVEATPPAMPIDGLAGAATAARETASLSRPTRAFEVAPRATQGGEQASDASDDRPSGGPSVAALLSTPGAVSALTAPDTGRQGGAQQSPAARRPARVDLSSSTALAGPTPTSTSSSEASSSGAGMGALAAAESAPAESLLDDLAGATSTQPARSTSRPGMPGRHDTRRASPSASATRGIDRPAFQPLVVASPAPTAPPSREAKRYDNTPYRSRFGEAKLEAIEEHGGSVETERAVAAGLRYLSLNQLRSGQWGSADDYDDKYGHVAVGKSALCLLAFLGAGHTPDSYTEHSEVTRRAIDFLLSVQDDETGHFGFSSSYSHGITTYALAECYALTSDRRLRKPLERAVSWILQNQSRVRDPRMFGGWSYYYPDHSTYDRWPRASVTAWQVMALESARLAGLDVPDNAFTDAAAFLRATHRRDRGVLLYNHDPTRLRSSYWTLPGSTPASLFALSLMGEDVTSNTWKSVVDYIEERAPSGYRNRGTDAFVHQAEGNLYFWYYGSLALFRHGGEPWQRWNQRLQSTLLPSQQADGSWIPISQYSDYAGDDRDDRSYTTAMCVLTLEVYYRYFTPLLQVKPGDDRARAPR